MPITPGEAGKLTPEEEEFLKGAERYLDEKLGSYNPRNSGWTKNVPLGEVLSGSSYLQSDRRQRLLSEIITRYEAAGWKVEQTSDYREGDFLTFRVREG